VDDGDKLKRKRRDITQDEASVTGDNTTELNRDELNNKN